jgi:hypothetical protein
MTCLEHTSVMTFVEELEVLAEALDRLVAFADA